MLAYKGYSPRLGPHRSPHGPLPDFDDLGCFLGQVLISSHDPIPCAASGAGANPGHSHFGGAAALATSTIYPPQPRRVIPGPQGLRPLCFTSEVSDRISALAILQADEESSTAERVFF